jgi:putative transcriptional regulator
MNRLSQEQNPISINGMLLVATPKVSEGLFQQSVCLVVNHNQQGAAALLLNRPIPTIDVLGAALSAKLPALASKPDISRLHFGGPCSGPLVAIHKHKEFAEAGGLNGIYIAADLAKVEQAAKVADDDFRLIVGHSLWQPGQLENEIKSGCWYILPAMPDLVFAPDDEMWGRGMRFVGRALLSSMTGIKHFPESPLLN